MCQPQSADEGSDLETEPPETFRGKKVVICLGNPYMTDDGVGFVAADQLLARHLEGVAVYKFMNLDLSLLWAFRFASKVVVVDAIESDVPPVTIQTYSVTRRDERLTRLPSLHTLQLYDVFDVAGSMGLEHCPVTLVGIRPLRVEPGDRLTDEVSKAVPLLVEAVIRELGDG